MSTNVDAAIVRATTNFRVIFDSSLRKQGLGVIGEMCAQRTSKGQKTTYRYMPLGVGYEEVVGSLHFRQDRRYEYDVTNSLKAAGFSVPIDEFKDADTNGLEDYEDRSRQLAMAPGANRRRQLAALMWGGFTATGPDGVTFFNTAHPKGPDAPSTASRSNRLSGDPLLTEANLQAAIDLLVKMSAYNGDALNISEMGELCLTVPSALRATAEDLLLRKKIDGGDDNPLYMRAKLRVMPELDRHTSAGWFLSVEGEGIPKPFVHQEREKPQMSSLTNPDSDTVFKERKVLYKVEGRDAMGYQHFEMIVASDGTDD